MKNLGFTLVELLVIIGILAIIIGIFYPSFRSFQKESDLNNSVEEILNTLRLAQNKTITSEGASQYGVHFEAGKYVLFKGAIYNPAATENEIHNLPESVEIYEIGLTGGGSEVVFNRVTGTANQSGEVSLRLKTDTSKAKTVYIENSGQVGPSTPIIPSDTARIKDSRHVHFNYGRPIDTATEKLTLTFEGGVTKEIIIADNLKDGQIFWEGEVDVGGSIQKLKIHTHRLNDAVLGTQFSIHRDRRFNNKALTVTISGDSSGNLIQYSADGEESRGTSIYLSSGGAGDPQRQ